MWESSLVSREFWLEASDRIRQQVETRQNVGTILRNATSAEKLNDHRNL